MNKIKHHIEPRWIDVMPPWVGVSLLDSGRAARRLGVWQAAHPGQEAGVESAVDVSERVRRAAYARQAWRVKSGRVL